MKIKWINGGTNVCLYAPDKTFYISYNSMKTIVMPFHWQSDNGSSETALYRYSDDEFFVLNGDFTNDYEKIIDKGFDTCMQFYLSKRDKHISSYSSDFDEYVKSKNKQGGKDED